MSLPQIIHLTINVQSILSYVEKHRGAEFAHQKKEH